MADRPNPFVARILDRSSSLALQARAWEVQEREGDRGMSAPTDEDLLRVISRVTLGHIPGLMGEGLDTGAVTEVVAHAMALGERTLELEAFPEGYRTHALALWELLAVLTGPVSRTLLNWLDEALGSRA